MKRFYSIFFYGLVLTLIFRMILFNTWIEALCSGVFGGLLVAYGHNAPRGINTKNQVNNG